LSVSMRFSWNI